MNRDCTQRNLMKGVARLLNGYERESVVPKALPCTQRYRCLGLFRKKWFSHYVPSPSRLSGAGVASGRAHRMERW